LSFLGNSKELLLAYSGMKNQTLSHSVNIMLTPQFYTLKKEKLPLKYLYQAKKIASSLFDGFLDEQKNYEYFVYKQRDEWIFIAYNPKEINALLASKGSSLLKQKVKAKSILSRPHITIEDLRNATEVGVFFKEQGFTKLILNTHLLMERAHNFYEKNGECEGLHAMKILLHARSIL